MSSLAMLVHSFEFVVIRKPRAISIICTPYLTLNPREIDYYLNDSKMADKCISCNRTVTARQEAIQCDGCLKWNHRTCNTGKLNLFFSFNKTHLKFALSWSRSSVIRTLVAYLTSILISI